MCRSILDYIEACVRFLSIRAMEYFAVCRLSNSDSARKQSAISFVRIEFLFFLSGDFSESTKTEIPI